MIFGCVSVIFLIDFCEFYNNNNDIATNIDLSKTNKSFEFVNSVLTNRLKSCVSLTYAIFPIPTIARRCTVENSNVQ